MREANVIPSDATHATMTVTVRVATKTAGAYLRYTLDRTNPTGGPSGHGKLIAASSGTVTFGFGHKQLRAIAYKAGWTTSLIAVGHYVYESGGNR